MNFSVISTVNKDTVVVHRTLPITVIHRAKGGTEDGGQSQPKERKWKEIGRKTELLDDADVGGCP